MKKPKKKNYIISLDIKYSHDIKVSDFSVSKAKKQAFDKPIKKGNYKRVNFNEELLREKNNGIRRNDKKI